MQGLKKGRQRHHFASETEIRRNMLGESETKIEKGTLWLTEMKTEWEKERREDKYLNWQLIPQIFEGF